MRTPFIATSVLLVLGSAALACAAGATYPVVESVVQPGRQDDGGRAAAAQAREDPLRLVSRAVAAGLDDQRVGGDAEVGRVTRARTIEVVAGDFKFEPAVIDVVEGERVVLKARVTDGKKHGLGIKELGVKAALPKTGEVVLIEFTAGAPGTYTIACSVYCGSGHKRMKGQLVVSARK